MLQDRGFFGRAAVVLVKRWFFVKKYGVFWYIAGRGGGGGLIERTTTQPSAPSIRGQTLFVFYIFVTIFSHLVHFFSSGSFVADE